MTHVQTRPRTKVPPEHALSSAIERLGEIIEQLRERGLAGEARSLITTTDDLVWQLEELTQTRPG